MKYRMYFKWSSTHGDYDKRVSFIRTASNKQEAFDMLRKDTPYLFSNPNWIHVSTHINRRKKK